SRRERRRGYQLGLAFERRHGAIRFSGAADYASGDFGGVWSADVTGEETFLGRLAVSTRLGEARLTGSYLHRSRGGEQDDFLQLATSFEAPFLGWVTVSAQEGLGDSDETDVHVFLSRSLGGRTNFSASLDPGSDSRVAGAAIQRNLPTGEGLGYRAAVAVGEAPGAQGRLLYQSATQTYTAEASQTEAGTQLRAGVSGAVALVGGEVVASRKLNDSFAVVKVGEFEGVRVYSDNRLVGRTNKSGIAVVPSLRSYDRNLISIEQGDLPIEAELGELEQEVRPYARNGVLVDFKAEVTGGAFITVELEDGKPLPAGAKARVNGLPTNFVSAPGGEIFLTGLDIENRVQIQWAQGSCELRVIKFRTGEAQPRLGRQVCKVEKANVG
ncbi:MAG TPA: fimbria/pilus outer membrane usher protein, partial [Caulobacteraceae bacterium]|nr:fimbria/pilus outer membrane usher protein [Caulobacteraceae bacterium]